MNKVVPSNDHIFTQRVIGKIDVGLMYASMVANKDSIFIFGGDNFSYPFTPSSEVKRYDILEQRWYIMKEMPHYLWAATSQIIDDKVYIMGGGRMLTYTSYNLVYDIKSDSWEEKAGLPISRKGLLSGIIDGIIYIACGYRMCSIYNVKPYCYAYNPKDDTWKQCQSPLRNRAYAMSVVVNNCLYLLGGYTPNDPHGDCISMDRYCPKTNLWEVMPDMPRPRRGAVAVAIGSKIFILCGNAYDSDDDDITIDYYDTITREWTISNIPTPILESPGVVMIDNKIYLTGGGNESGRYNVILYEITYGGMKE